MSLLESNLVILARHQPELAARLGALAKTDDVQVSPSRQGPPTGRARARDGSWIQLHSRVSPDTDDLEIQTPRNKVGEQASLLVGTGLGYPLLRLADRVPRDQWLVAVELRLDLLHAALSTHDLGSILQRPTLLLIAGDDPTQLMATWDQFLEDQDIDTLEVARHPATCRLAPAEYAQLAQELQHAQLRRKAGQRTISTHGRQLLANSLRNIPDFLRARGVVEFEGRFRNVPGYILGAGPSLNEALPHLRRIQDHALVISVDKCTKLAISEGLRPHASVITDMSAGTQPFFQDIDPETAPPLLFEPDAFWESVSSYPAEKISFETTVPWTSWAAACVDSPHGELEKAFSVAHTAFFFLAAMGANPIVLVGVDLGFPGNMTHAAGVAGWRAEATTYSADQVMLPSVTGKPLLSNTAFAAFAMSFETYIGRHSGEIWQTAPAGVRLAGARNVSIEEAVDTARRRDPVPPLMSVLPRGDRVAPDWARLRKQIQQVRARARQLSDHHHAAVPLLAKVHGLDPTSPSDELIFEAAAPHLNDLSAAVQADVETLQLFERVILCDRLEIARLDRRMRRLEGPQKAARRRLQHQAMELLFESYHKAARAVLEELSALEEMLPDTSPP